MNVTGVYAGRLLTAASVLIPLAVTPFTASPAPRMGAGVNLSGLEENAGTLPGTPNTDYPVPSDWELWYYQTKGIDLIRLPILWERLQPDLLDGQPSHPFDPMYLGLITTFIAQAAARDMRVIIDLHDYGAYWGNKIGGGVLTQVQFAAFWQMLGGVLVRSKGVAAYDLMNEPNGMPDSQVWPAAAQAAVDAIRLVDTHTHIMVEGDGWSSACGWSGNNGSLAINDPAHAVTYQAHVYGDADCSGTHYAWADAQAQGVTVDTIAERLADFIAWCRGKGCMVGEIGVGNDSPNWNIQLARGLAAAQAGGMHCFTYWAGGPWWGDYPLSIEPTTPNGGLVDAVQMAVVSTYGSPPAMARAFWRNTSAANWGNPNP